MEEFRSIYPFRVPVKAPFARLETLKFTLVIVFKMHSITDDLQTGMAQVRPERSKSTGWSKFASTSSASQLRTSQMLYCLLILQRWLLFFFGLLSLHHNIDCLWKRRGPKVALMAPENMILWRCVRWKGRNGLTVVLWGSVKDIEGRRSSAVPKAQYTATLHGAGSKHSPHALTKCKLNVTKWKRKRKVNSNVR